jgi:hypothetical protein
MSILECPVENDPGPEEGVTQRNQHSRFRQLGKITVEVVGPAGENLGLVPAPSGLSACQVGPEVIEF